MQDVLEQSEGSLLLGAGAREQVLEVLQVGRLPAVAGLGDTFSDLLVGAVEDAVDQLQVAHRVLDRGVHREELDVHAVREAVGALAHGAAHLDGVHRGVDELARGVADPGAKLVVHHVGNHAAHLLLGGGRARERLPVLGVGQLALQLGDHRVEVALGVDLDAGALHRVGDAPDRFLLGGRRQARLVRAQLGDRLLLVGIRQVLEGSATEDAAVGAAVHTVRAVHSVVAHADRF